MGDSQIQDLTRWRADEVELAPEAVDPSILLEGEPDWWTTVIWKNADQTTVSGAFRSTPGKFTYAPPADEVTFVRAGHVVISSEDGTTEEFRAGDTMALVGGANYVFEVRETLEDSWVWSAKEPIEL